MPQQPPTTKTVDLGFRPRVWQYELAQALKTKRFGIVALHRQGGKSTVAELLLAERAIKAKGDLPMFAYIAPELRQARTTFWPRLKHRLAKLAAAGGCTVSESELSITFKSNGAVIRCFGASDPDALRGMTLHGVVVDEVAQMKAEVWEEILSPMLMTTNGWALFIGTPKGINLFSDLYEKAGKLPDWYRRIWTCYETGALPASEIERQKSLMTEKRFAREMLCDFTAQADDQLISLVLATEASQRVWKPHDPVILAAPVILGVDPARFGDDRSVIVRRQGLAMFPPLVFKGVDNVWLAKRIAFEINQHKPAAVFIDEGGVGAGVIDVLRQQLGHQVQAVKFGGSAVKAASFINHRAEMWWAMREWLEAGGSIPNDPVLIRELATPTYGFNGKQQVTLESKDDIRERLPEAGSPDIADALACTFSAPVHPVRRFDDEDDFRARGSGSSYDPFDMRRQMNRRR